MPKDIFSFIKQEEAAYALPITVIDGWEWSMKEHIRLTTLYKNSQFSVGNSAKERDMKPFKNIVRPILNLQYRAEGFDVKDIVLYIDDTKAYFKSFLIKKYHERWANEIELDTFIDEMVESYCDYGGVLIKDVNDKKPEVVPLSSLAFCDQTDMLSGPFAIKHYYSPDELQGFAAVGWGDPKNGATITIEEAIVLAGMYKIPDSQNGEEAKTPGKYVEVFEVNGVLPDDWLVDGDPDKYTRQMQIVMFYKDVHGEKVGVKLFAGKRNKQIFKQLLRDRIYGRALGLGGVEELFEDQVWTNDSEIKKLGMLEIASKMFFKTTDDAFAERNQTLDGENGQVYVVADGKDIGQLNTQPVNVPYFDKAVEAWQTHAQLMGGATDAILGQDPPSGTPFALQQLVTNQSQGLHTYRQGKIATFFSTVEREWILPWIVKDIASGKKFLAELSLEELQQVADSLVMCQTNDIIKEQILAGRVPDPEELAVLQDKIRTQFMKGGNKKFLEIFAGEMKDADINIMVDVAGKQKDLNKVVNELTNIFRQIVANPAVLDDPRMANIFNQILEASGLSPIDFGMALPKPAAPANPNSNPQPSLVKPLATAPAA